MMSAFEMSIIALKQVSTIAGKGTLNSMKWVIICREFSINVKEMTLELNSNYITKIVIAAPLNVSLDNSYVYSMSSANADNNLCENENY